MNLMGVEQARGQAVTEESVTSVNNVIHEERQVKTSESLGRKKEAEYYYRDVLKKKEKRKKWEGFMRKGVKYNWYHQKCGR